jgi:hypothetical protein
MRVLESEPDGASRVKQLRAKLGKAAEERNTVMHSVYVSQDFFGGGPRNLRTKLGISKAQSVRTVEERVDVKALDETAKQTEALANEVVEFWVDVYKLHGQRKRG